MKTPATHSPADNRWWLRRVAVLPLGLILLVLGALLVSGFRVKTQTARLAHRLSVERHTIEAVTNVRRDARKTYVALLERWLAPPEDWQRLSSDVVAQRAALTQSLRGLGQATGLDADEKRYRAELTADVVAWLTVVERIRTASDGSGGGREIRQGLNAIDRDCSESLKFNADIAARDEADRSALGGQSRQLEAASLAALALLALYAAVLYLQRTAARRIEAASRLQQQQEAQSLLLERVVRTRTSELEESHRLLNGSLVELSSSKQILELRVRELATMQNQLVQAEKLQAVGQLAAGIAHEINTPAQYIGDNIRFVAGAFLDIDKALAAAERALAAAREGRLTPGLIAEVDSEIAGADLPYLRSETPAAIAQAEEGVQRVSAIVRAMKDFAHPGPPEMAPADLNRVVESTVTVCRSEWKHVADLTLDLAPALPVVPCQIGGIKQVVLNLVVNAAHAIADIVGDGAGGKGRIVIATRQDGAWAEISVADSGTGIPAAVRDRIFDPFFTTKALGRGSGQGLAVTHAVVGGHGGSITFETREGAGTTFRVRLPLVQQAADDRERVEQMAAPAVTTGAV